MVTADDVRRVGLALPRTYEFFTGGRYKLKVRQIVYVGFSKDETLMGFGFPKSERQYLVDTEPDKFMLPDENNMRFHWVVARMDRLEPEEMEEYVIDAWSMCVPKFLSKPYRADDEP